MSMTPERKEENKLKKGDRVVMHTCIEAEEQPGKIWTCKTDQFTRGKGILAQDSVFLQGYSGSFAPEFLQKVILPTEDESLLAALEEAERQVEKTKKSVDAIRARGDKWEKAFDNADRQYLKKEREAADLQLQLTGKIEELGEAQQTIARQREALTWYGDKGNYQYEVPTSGYLRFISPVQVDDGVRARAALGEGDKES